MLIIFIYSLLIIILTIPFSRILLSNNNNNFYSYSKELLFGMIFLSFIAIFLNFFTSLNTVINSAIPLLSLIILFKHKKNYFNKKFLIFLLSQSIFITILVTESNVYRPDAGLYHLPFIGILNSEKIILGLSNIHFRYGHTSIIQYFSAINNNIIFFDNGIIFAQALIASSVTLCFLYQIYIYNKTKNFNFHFFFIFFVSIYIAYKMNRYSEFGNDAPAHFLVFFLISEILIYKTKFTNKEFINQLFVSLFIITNKITLIPILIFNLIDFKKIDFNQILFNKKLYVLSFFLFMWLIKNTLMTGCLVYPVKQFCFNNFIWTDIKTIKKVAVSSEAWTKGISDIKNENIEIKQFNKNFIWIEAWLSKHFIYIINILIPYIILLFLILFIIKFNANKKKLSEQKNNNLIIFISFITVLVWFIKAPMYRYGYSLIVVFISLIFSNLLTKTLFKKEIVFRMSNFIVILILIAITSKNLFRIIKTNNNYYNYPWVKYYSMKNDNKKNILSKTTLRGKNLTIPDENYCMYTKTVCAHYGLPNNFDIIKFYNYEIFYIRG